MRKKPLKFNFKGTLYAKKRLIGVDSLIGNYTAIHLSLRDKKSLMSYQSIFNDVVGPVMRRPSGSHCATSLRIGRICNDLMGEVAFLKSKLILIRTVLWALLTMNFGDSISIFSKFWSTT